LLPEVVSVSENILYDAIVVGGGPGGCTTAVHLAKKGRKVLLLDKENWPRDKTCGDAVSGKTLRHLREMGLETEVEKAEHGEITQLTFSSPNGNTVTIPLKNPESKSNKSYVCRRMVLDNIQWQNAKRHADSHEGMAVVGVVRENGKICGVKAKAKDGQEFEFRGRMVIGADGAASVIAREVRGPEIDPKHTCIAHRAYYSGITGMKDAIEIHFAATIMPGYFWIFPLENGLANVGVGMMMENVRKGNVDLQKAMLDLIATNPLFTERFKNAKIVSPNGKISAWTLPMGSKRRQVHTDNVLLVGDAAGLVDPFSGEGMGNAMLSGTLAAQVADEALAAKDTSAQFLSRYEKQLWDEVGDELSLSYTMQKLGNMHWLLDMVVGKAAKSEKAREAIAGTFINEKAKKGYASPVFYLKILLS